MSIQTAGKVLELPDLACIGMVKSVGDVKLSEKGVYHVLPLEIEGRFSGKDGMFFFIFEPRWFERTFDPAALAAEDKAFNEDHAAEIKAKRAKRAGKYGIYRRYINDTAKPSVLKSLCSGEDDVFVKVAEAFDKLEKVGAKNVEEIFREFLLGRDVGYIMAQRTDEDGGLMEQYNIQRFFPMTEDGMKALLREAGNPKRKHELVVTWDE